VVLREGRITHDGPPTSLEHAGDGDHCEPLEPAVHVPPMSGLLEEER
jgi:hypothetical protein